MRRGEEDVARKLAKALLFGLGIGMVAAFVIGAPGMVVLITGGGVAIVAVGIRLTVLLIVGAVHRLGGPTVTDTMPEDAAASPARPPGRWHIRGRTAGPASALRRV
jgi:Mg/Co/Ni transporter MgtE